MADIVTARPCVVIEIDVMDAHSLFIPDVVLERIGRAAVAAARAAADALRNPAQPEYSPVTQVRNVRRDSTQGFHV